MGGTINTGTGMLNHKGAPMMQDYQTLRATFAAHGQDHVFAGWENLDDAARGRLLASCAAVDFAWLQARRAEMAQPDAAPAADIAPPLVVPLPRTDAERARMEEARVEGVRLLRAGEVAALLVAGGQGTRLGFPGPKGCLPVGPVSGRTLFHWHAEQIAANVRRYGRPVPWYIMTSEQNDAVTREFFAAQNWFGLNPEDVFFFRQAMVPCLDFEGRLMLGSRSKLALNPNGHGGVLHGLQTSGALTDMQRRGIRCITFFQVDNPLVTICDPVFLGLHMLHNAEMSCKSVPKTHPMEKMGLVCTRRGRPAIAEYIDVTETQKRALLPDGQLRLNAGSIAAHIINVDFAARIARDCALPWHRSTKKIAFWDGTRVVTPAKENGIKFETFVFDALPLAAASVTMECVRAHEFAPVKNLSGADSLDTCRAMLSDCFKAWLATAGVDTSAIDIAEIAPGYALDCAELVARAAQGLPEPQKEFLLE